MAARQGSERLFAMLDTLSRTADFRVSYAPLQRRVWQLIDALHASPVLYQQMFIDGEWAAVDGYDPFVSFELLEGRVAALRMAPVL
ncbi:NEL-type E3 ubiquitin ligase domain-containing protein [Pseudomonas prosekii]|uniref:NEL-type E3 ubiquitin ligase domain-containing protein n=1 Tax=Pseudomonas prosekii TaxID=1148509 RepID=UPI003F7507D6